MTELNNGETNDMLDVIILIQEKLEIDEGSINVILDVVYFECDSLEFSIRKYNDKLFSFIREHTTDKQPTKNMLLSIDSIVRTINQDIDENEKALDFAFENSFSDDDIQEDIEDEYPDPNEAL